MCKVSNFANNPSRLGSCLPGFGWVLQLKIKVNPRLVDLNNEDFEIVGNDRS